MERHSMHVCSMQGTCRSVHSSWLGRPYQLPLLPRQHDKGRKHAECGRSASRHACSSYPCTHSTRMHHPSHGCHQRLTQLRAVPVQKRTACHCSTSAAQPETREVEDTQKSKGAQEESGEVHKSEDGVQDGWLDEEDATAWAARRSSSGAVKIVNSSDFDEEGDGDTNGVPEDLGGDSSVGTTPELEGLLAGGEASCDINSLQAAFPFRLDAFQRRAVERFLKGSSVVVCAPTGAGKTAIAEAAAIATLARGKRVIYTTPLKALSNQKLLEMRKLFGPDRVGLQTGDTNLNPSSLVVVMTTEILRNILYRDKVGDNEEGDSANSRQLADIGCIVLDEVHYLGNPDRGTVWEEVIVNCPPGIPMLCMSATVANPGDLGGWITEVHGPCETIKTSHRPVPLTWHFCLKKRGVTRLVPLLNSRGTAINEELHRRSDEYDGDPDDIYAPKMVRRRRGRRKEEPPPRTRLPPNSEVVRLLAERELLPAIWFIFNRSECDGTATAMHRSGEVLTSGEEQKEIQAEVLALKKEQPEAVRRSLVLPLVAGFASHHAGLLPAWKTLIERLFQRGLIKVVFATDTLAAGINMPARTTVISTIFRRRNTGTGTLEHNEMLQMAGRAGRRGYDTSGNCVVLQDRFYWPDSAVDMITRGPERLTSQLTTGYNMVLNLLASRSPDEARAFLQRTFSAWLGGAGAGSGLREAAALRARAGRLMRNAEDTLAGVEDDEVPAEVLQQYMALQARLQAERRLLRELRAEAGEQRAAAVKDLVRELGVPRMVHLDTQGSREDMIEPLPALLTGYTEALLNGELFCSNPEELDRPGRIPNLEYMCLGPNNSLLWVQPSQILAIGRAPPTEDQVTAAKNTLFAANNVMYETWLPMSGGVGDEAPGSASTAPGAAAITLAAVEAAALEPVPIEPGLAERLAAQEARVAEVRGELAWQKQDDSLKRRLKRATKLRKQAEALLQQAQEIKSEPGAATWQEFEDRVAVLVEAGALEEGSLAATPLGQVARQVNGQNELWLATVLTHPATQALAPPELAGLLAAMVTPEIINKVQVWAAYEPSERVVEAVEALEDARAELYEQQAAHEVNDSLEVDLRPAGIVEAWAGGSSWEQVMTDCNLDDGDVARILCRTVDLLKQVKFCSALLPDMRDAARAAMKAMTRQPISDLVVL